MANRFARYVEQAPANRFAKYSQLEQDEPARTPDTSFFREPVNVGGRVGVGSADSVGGAELESDGFNLAALDSINVVPRGVGRLAQTGALAAGLGRDVLAESQNSDTVSPFGILLRRALGGAQPKETKGLLAAEEISRDLQRNIDERFPKPQAQAQTERELSQATGVMDTLGALVRNPVGSMQLAGESLASSLPAIRAAGIVAGSGLASGASATSAGEEFDNEFAQFQQTPMFEALRRAIGDENVAKYAEREKARRIQQSLIGSTVGGAATAGITSRIGLNPIDQAIAGRAGALSSRIPATIRETAGEAVEGGGTQAITNLFTGADPLQDVATSATMEAALGGLTAAPVDIANAGSRVAGLLSDIGDIGTQAADLTRQAQARATTDRILGRTTPPQTPQEAQTDAGAGIAEAAIQNALAARPVVSTIQQNPNTSIPTRTENANSFTSPVAQSDMRENDELDRLLVGALGGAEDGQLEARGNNPRLDVSAQPDAASIRDVAQAESGNRSEGQFLSAGGQATAAVSDNPQVAAIPRQAEGAVDVAPPKPRNYRDTQFDERKHDLLDFIAMNGGLDRASAESEGVDPAVWKAKSAENDRFFGKPAFKKGGMSIETLREKLAQSNFAPIAQGRDALDLVFDALGGREVVTPDGATWRQQQRERDESDRIQRALSDLPAGMRSAAEQAQMQSAIPDGDVESLALAQQAERDQVRDDILSALPSVQDQSPAQRVSAQSLGADYTDRLLSLMGARKSGAMTEAERDEYTALLEQDRETGKVNGRPMVGVGNKTGYVDALSQGRLRPVQVFTDADQFKLVNDKFGHDVGDEVIRLYGSAMIAEFGQGRVWHRGGDEFLADAETDAEADAAMARVAERMRNIRLEVPLSDGRTAVLEGIGVSYGKGATEKDADEGLKRDKERRKRLGLRADRQDADSRSVDPQPDGAWSQAGRADSRRGDGAQGAAAAAEGVAREDSSMGRDRAGSVASDGRMGLEAGNGTEQVGARGTDGRGSPDGDARSGNANASGRAGSVSAAGDRADGGSRIGAVRSAVSRALGSKFLRRLESQPWFNLVESLDQLPPDVRKSISGDDIAGFVLPDGRVFIIAENVGDNATGIVLHEVGVHFGMAGLPDFPAMLAQFKRMRPRDGAVARAYESVPKDTPADLIDEEAFAYYVEQNWNAKTPLMTRIKDAIARLLNRLGVPTSGITDALMRQALDGMVQSAREAADRATRGLVTVRDGKIVYHKAWHGSPHDFDKFRLDDSTIGTGEGAQAYGHGLYFAGKRELADWYKVQLSGRTITGVDGSRYGASQKEAEADARRLLLMMRASPKEFAAYDDGGQSYIGKIVRDIKRGKIKADEGRLYEVELAPDESDYLDWDAPLSEQSERTRDAVKAVAARVLAEGNPSNAQRDLRRVADEYSRAEMLTEIADRFGWKVSGNSLMKPDGSLAPESAIQDYLNRKQGGTNYRDAGAIYRDMAAAMGSDRAVSAMLLEAGIPGIRYLDGSSRGKGEGSRNYVIFDDSLVKVQAKYSFAGRNAKTANIGTLEQAQAMIADGASAEDARKATGWFKGRDGKWRFEIDDSGARISSYFANEMLDNSEKRGVYLKSVLDHPALFDAYPDLGMTLVDWKRSGGLGGGDAAFLGNKITLNAPSAKDAFSLLLHEIQHAIQGREGFAKGGSPADPNNVSAADLMREENARFDRMQRDAESSKEYRDFVADFIANIPESERMVPSRRGDGMVDVSRQLAEAAARKRFIEPIERERVAAIDAIAAEDKNGGDIGGLIGYRRLAGETEARNVQTRQRMTAAERRDTSPRETQDVSDEQQIVITDEQDAGQLRSLFKSIGASYQAKYSRRADGGSVSPMTPRARAVSEIVAAMQEHDGDFGLRVIDGDAAVGDKLAPSTVWKNGEPTSRKLRGSSSAEVRRADEKSVEAALESLGIGKKGPNGYYFGKTVALIKGRRVGRGEDAGESIIAEAEVIGVWQKETKGNSDILPNEPDDSRQAPPREGLGASGPRYSRSTITVDGVERPTTDSTGKPIHPTEEGLRNFWRWFSGSKIADAKERPIAVHHGTNATTFIPATTKAGSASAKAELERMAAAHGIKEWDSVAGIFNRWIEYGMADEQGVTRQVAEHARELHRQAKSSEESKSRAELAFDAFNLPDGETELGSHFGTESQAMQRGTPFPFYLSITNPIRLPDLGTWNYQNVMRELRKRGVKISEAEYDAVFNARDNNVALRELMLAKGIDGVVYKNEAEGSGDSYIALKPEQIKSATGNSGSFSPTDKRIAYSRRTPQQAQAESAQKQAELARGVGAVPGQTFAAQDRFTDDWKGTLRKAREKIQDKLLSVRDVQEDVEKVRGAVTDAMNVYRRENLMHGRVGQQRDELERTHIKPLLDAMAKAKVAPELLEDYVEARHAEERNKAIAAKQGGMPDAGAGMTTQAAADFLAGNAAGHRSGVTLTPDLTRTLDRLARRVDAITAETRQRLYQSGQITKQQLTELENAYQFYVPLRGKDGEEDAARGGTGKGIDVRGKPIQRALGRGDGNRAVNILAEVVADAERSIITAEKTRVGRTLARLVIENPNPDVWAIEPVKTEQAYSESADEIYMAVKNIDQDPNTIIVKVSGKPYRIYIEDTRIAEALKNLAAEQLPTAVQVAAGLNRYFSAVLTRYNPSFVAVNLVRDMIFGMTGIAAENGAKQAADAAKNYLPAMRSMWREARGTLGNSRMDRFADEFSRAGGKTYFGKLENVPDIAQRIGMEFKTARQIAFGERRLAAAIGKLAKDSRMVQAIENANDAVENALRLAAYAARREAGASVEQAAEYAKNITVNFNRRGAYTSWLNALYLFFNASVQGTHRVFRLLKNRKVQAALGGLALAQAVFAMIAMGYDDEDGEPLWDSIPEWEKQRNFIIVYPYINKDGKVRATTFKIPMPYGFNIFPYLGGRTAALVNDIGNSKKHAIRDYINDSTAGVLGAMAPLPFGEEGGFKAWLPHWLRLAGMLSENKDDLGMPIRAGEQNDEYERPRAAKGRDDTSEAFKMLATALNRVGGGDDYNKPMMPWLLDWAPEDLEFIAATAGGGLSGTAIKGQRMTEKLIAGVPVNFKDVPILSSFVSNVDQRQATSSRYYERKDEIERQIAQQRDIAKETGNVEDNKLGIRIARNKSGQKIKRGEGYELEGARGSLFATYKEAEKEITRIRDEMRATYRDSSVDFGERARRIDALKVEREEVQREVNAKWREVFGRKSR